MKKIIKEITILLIVIFSILTINNTSFGVNSVEMGSNYIKITAKSDLVKKSNGSWDWGGTEDPSAEDHAYYVYDNDHFKGYSYKKMPRLLLTGGLLCLDHDNDANNLRQDDEDDKDGTIRDRIRIEGCDMWIAKQGKVTQHYDSIKGKTGVTTDRGKTNAKIAYIMNKATYSKCNNSNRKSAGLQGAIWKLAETFVNDHLKESPKITPYGSGLISDWLGDNGRGVLDEATDYANKCGNYSIPSKASVESDISWKIINNKLVVGPFKISYSIGDNDLKTDGLTGNHNGYSICDANGGNTVTSIKNNEPFYLKINNLDYTGGSFTFTTTFKDSINLDGIVFVDSRVSNGAAQMQLFAATNKNDINNSVRFTLTSPSLKIVKKDKETGAVVKKAGFKFKVTGDTGKTYNLETNSNGEAIQSPIRPGTYTIEETAVGSNEYDCNFYPVKITGKTVSKGTLTVNATNEKIGWLKIIKKDKYTQDAMKGVTFIVRGPNNYSKEVTTNDQGIAILKPVPKGDYTITEKSIDESIGNNWQYEASSSVNTKVTVGSGEKEAPLYNEKKFINISGRVFEDNLPNAKRK